MSSRRRVMSIPALVVTALALVSFALSPAAVAGPAARGSAAARTGPVAVGRAAAPMPPNIDVSQQIGNHAEDAIAANPIDPQNVVAMSMRGNLTKGLFVGVTFDGGQTWSRRVIARLPSSPLGRACCDEDLAWDRYGNLWLSYLLQPSFEPVVAVSTDGGLTFRKVAEIIPTPWRARAHLGFAGDQPHIAVGPHSVWVSFTGLAFNLKTKNIVGVRTEASGAHIGGLGRFGRFIRAEAVPAPHAMGDYGDTAVGPHGQVMLVYQTGKVPARCCSQVFTTVDPDGLGPRGFAAPRLVASSDVGSYYTIPAQPTRGVYNGPRLAWYDGPGRYHGRIYVVWTQATPRLSDNLNTMFQYSDNDGRTWSKAVPLTDPQTSGSEFFPAIAVDQATGHVAVGWYDCRNAEGQGGAGCRKPDSWAQFWVTISTDGGRKFRPAFQVSEGTSNAKDANAFFNYGDYTHLAFQSNWLYPAWSDNSNSTGNNPNGTLHAMDLYMAALRVR